MEIKRYDNEQVRLTMHFDNGETYTAQTNADGDRIIITINISENEGNTNGNPLGIMSSNSINFTIFDKEGVLIKTNKKSPYYGFMRNGVRTELEWQDNTGTWHDFGTYYTNSWSNSKAEGGYQNVSIGAQDRLNYIGSLPIPELPAFSGIELKSLLDEIFKAIGLGPSEYWVDPSLDLRIAFSMTKGQKLRDTLNSIAQALVARISINRSGVIELKPAYPDIPRNLDTLSDEWISSGSMEQHQYADYSSVQLSYFELGKAASTILATLDAVTTESGENKFDNLQISNRVQGIEMVSFEYAATRYDYQSCIDDISYTGYQGGVSVNITASGGYTGSIIVQGRETGNSEVVVTENIFGADSKISNTLMLSSEYIQNRQDAKNYLNKVVNYIESIRNSGTFNQCLYGFDLKTGKYVELISDDPEIDGIYYIDDITFNLAEQYSCTIGATRFER